MSKSKIGGLEQVQTYVSPNELKNLDKIANNCLRSRSDTVRLMVAESIKKYAVELKLDLV